MPTPVLVALYWLAAISANLAVTLFGPGALPVTAAVMIPFDLTSRDVLHERWSDRPTGERWVRLAGLVIAGSALTYVVNQHAARIALASCAAFLVGGAVDTVTYALLHHHAKLVKMNGSNLLSAITDSVVFPWVAFGLVDAGLSTRQAVAKFAAGLLWSVVMVTWTRRRRPDVPHREAIRLL